MQRARCGLGCGISVRPCSNDSAVFPNAERFPDVLNRFVDSTNIAQTVHVMKYIFPRQFGLHNVFTSSVDKRETSHPFKDYTLREQEIARRRSQSRSRPGNDAVQQHETRLPKRLRGRALQLIGKLRRLHRKCAYVELLRYYCPVTLAGSAEVHPPGDRSSACGEASGSQSRSCQSQTLTTLRKAIEPAPRASVIDHATPASHVSAFCRAAVSKVFPDELWGSADVGRHNKDVVLRHVDGFVRMRRFESATLHTVMQNLKVGNIDSSRTALTFMP